MRWRIFVIIAVLSLLLCVTVAVRWEKSYRVASLVCFHSGDVRYSIAAGGGAVHVLRMTNWPERESGFVTHSRPVNDNSAWYETIDKWEPRCTGAGKFLGFAFTRGRFVFDGYLALRAHETERAPFSDFHSLSIPFWFVTVVLIFLP